MPLFDTAQGNTGGAWLWNQFADAFTGKNDIGQIAPYLQIAAPGAPTVAVNTTSGNLTGNYQYAVGFVTGYWEGPVGSGTFLPQGNTGGGALSAVVTLSAEQVNVSAIPVGPTGVYERIIYRTKAGGTTFYMLTTIADNTTTTFTDNIPDASLGAQMPTTNTTGSYWYGPVTIPSGQALTADGSVVLPNLTTLPTVGASGTVVVVNDQWYISNGTAWVAMAPTINKASSTASGTVELPSSAGTPATPITPYRATSVQEVEITGTTAQVVASYTPAAQGNFNAKMYVRVEVATTTVTITVTYTSASGAQTYPVITNQSLAVGDYTYIAPFFNATTASAIAINVTASTADQVYVSAVIVGE